MTGEISPKTEKEIRMYVQHSMGFLRATAKTVFILHHIATEYLFEETARTASRDPPNAGQTSQSPRSASDTSTMCSETLRDSRGGDPGTQAGGETARERERLQEAPWEAARKDPHGAVSKWPYLRYAAEFWFIHAHRGFKISKDQLHDNSNHKWLQYQFFETREKVLD